MTPQCEDCRWYGEIQRSIDDVRPFCGSPLARRWGDMRGLDTCDYEPVPTEETAS